MPVSRFSDIKKSNKLSEAYNNYKTWQDRPYDPNPNSRGASKNTKRVYVHPFGLEFVSDEFWSSKTDPTNYDAIATLINGTGEAAVTAALSGSDKDLSRRGFSPSRLIWFRNATRVVSVETSEITALKYLKYAGTRISVPFGQSSATDEEITSFSAIKKAALATTGFVVSRVSLQRERIDL